MSKNRPKIKLETKLFVWERDGWKCKYCRVTIIRCGPPDQYPWLDNTATVDHVIPLAADGTNARNNLVAACNKCNWMKGRSVRYVASHEPTLADVWPELTDEEKELLG